MENTWSYHNPVKITFGCGTRSSLLEAIKGLKILTVTTSRGRKFIEKDPILKELSKKTEWVDSISRNPDLNLIQNEINRFSGNFFDLIIAFGGGSSIDAAKALSCGLSPDICSRDILKLIIDPQKYLNKKLIPIYALPTTSGTGSEVTPFATIWDYANQKKLSLTHARIFPKIAIIDPGFNSLSAIKIDISKAKEIAENSNKYFGITEIILLFAIGILILESAST